MAWLKTIYFKYQQMFDYIFFGALTTLVNILVFFILHETLNIQYLLANAASIAAAIVFAFFTNKKYVFKSKSQTFKSAFKEFYLFLGLRLFSGLIDMLTMWILVDFIELETAFSKILTQFIVLVLNYLFSKLYVFK